MNHRIYLAAALVTAAMALAGCVSAPAPESAVQPWKPPQRARTSLQSWQELRARCPNLTKPLKLAELADIALQNNPASRKAWNDARVAAAQAQQARGYFMPTVTAQGSVTRQKVNSSVDQLDQDYLGYGPGLQLNYLIFNFGGGREAAVEQALHTVYAANYTFNSTLQGILLAVQQAYFGLVSAQAGITAAQAQLTDAQTALEFAKLRRDHGVGRELDVLQAQALMDQAAFLLAGAEGAEQNARAALTQALGLPADVAVQVAAPAQTLPAAVDAAQLTPMIDAALARRPDIAALRARLQASTSAIKVAGAPNWPSLYLNGHALRDYNKVWTGQFVAENDWNYGAGLSLQWTLFDGLQTRNARRAAAAQAASVRSQLQQAELAASAAVWSGHQNYQTALKKCAASAALLNSAQAAYDLALDSYKAGLLNILNLLTAEAQLARARSQNIAARQEAFTALANLAFASGTLDRENLDAPRAERQP
ncbi:MAG: TolC family protein [Kiritimatiellaeota bacterium]|nr:TolC family protein [Kiritimatiellota bacterium]